MNKGKVTCEKLKAIRREVAEKLGVEYNPEECTFKGDCLGTCPRCEQEAHMLMKEIIVRMEEDSESLEPVIHKLSVMVDLMNEVQEMNSPLGGCVC
jgi:hypothetical protein